MRLQRNVQLQEMKVVRDVMDQKGEQAKKDHAFLSSQVPRHETWS